MHTYCIYTRNHIYLCVCWGKKYKHEIRIYRKSTTTRIVSILGRNFDMELNNSYKVGIKLLKSWTISIELFQIEPII